MSWLSVAVVLGRFSRLVVGWAMAAHRDAELVEQARLLAGLLHHSDRGSQYPRGSSQALLAQAGIRVSRSGKGEWTDWHTYQTPRKWATPVPLKGRYFVKRAGKRIRSCPPW